MRGYLDRIWDFLAKRLKPNIRSTDKGIFDPYVPIGSVKPLSDDYQPMVEAAEPVTGEPSEPLSTDQPPTKRALLVFRLLVIVFVAILAFRLIGLQIVQGQQNYSLAEGNRLKTEPIPALRGLFYDSHGTPLVKNVANYSVVLNLSELPTKTITKTAFLAQVASALSLDPAALDHQIATDRNFSQLTLLDNLSRDQAMNYELELNDRNLNGVSVETVPIRQYSPAVPDLGHLLGYIGKVSAADLASRPGILPTGIVGKAGLEQQYDQMLQGTPGITTLEVDSTGRAIRSVGNQPPQSGQSIVLSLDSDVQTIASSALQTAINLNHATSGAAVALDPRTGNVLAMVSAPSFDNNLFSQNGNKAAVQAALTDPLSPLLNRAIAGRYPSGSTIKPVIASGALQEGVVTANTKFDTSQPITAGPQTFHDWKQHGISDIKQAIAQSNDIFFYTVGGGHGSIGGLGIDRLDKYLQKFGFGSQTGIDLPGEAAGNVPTPAWKKKVQNERWFLGDTYNLSIGQGGFLITPLQLANAISAIANGGTLYEPKMVKSFIDSTGQSKDVPSVPRVSNIIDAANIATVREGMHQAVQPGGTAHFILGSVPIDMGAKTGTAQTSASLTNTHAWFTAFAPFQNPEIAVSVVIEGGGEGFDVAGPVVRQIIEQYFHLPLSPVTPALPGG